MTLNKQKMVREIGRRTRLTNRDVQLILETLIDVWIEELVNDGRIELANFMVLETKIIDRGQSKYLMGSRFLKRITLRTSKNIRKLLKTSLETTNSSSCKNSDELS